MARSEVNYLYDDDTAFVAAGTGQTLTATGDLTSRVAIDKMTAVRPDSEQYNKLGAQGYAVVVVVSAVDVTTGDEAYTINVEATAAGGGTPVAVASVAIAAGAAVAGQYVVKIDSATMEKFATDYAELNVEIAAAGTTPSITIAAAWLALDKTV